jgi:putative ABC transport system ATP-binding protein
MNMLASVKGLEIAVHCAGVQKGFGAGDTRVRVLRGVDLDVRMGELLMLVGPSGCGKTTLISIVAGILDADEGECRIFGVDMKAMSTKEKTAYRGRTIGFVFQAFNLIPALSIVENTAIPLLLRGVERAEALERAAAMLARVGLGERTRSLPAQLSGGQQQRVAIARALVLHPRLVVCDEPTSALDHENGLRVMELLRMMAAEEGTTLIVVTHDARIFGHADRIAKVNDGRIVEVVESARPVAQSA